MKNKLLGALAFFITLMGHAQSSKITDISSFKPRSLSAIKDKNNTVNGYYLFYMVDKLKKGQREYMIQVLDQNLVEVARKTHIDDKNTYLLEGAFNEQSMMFALVNPVDKYATLLTYDKQANQTATHKIEFSKKEVDYLVYFKNNDMYPLLYPVEGRGFIYNKLEDNKKIGYTLKYYPTDGGKAWEYGSPEKSKDFKSVTPIEVNSKVVIAREDSRPNRLSTNITTTIKAIGVEDGKLLFERSYSKAKQPRLITNAFLASDNSVVLMGEYFKTGDNPIKDKSLGLFSEVIDLSGNTIKESFSSWEVDVAKLMKVNGSKVLDKGYIYFHDVIHTKSGEYYAIGEYYRKTANAGGIALAVLTRSAASNSMTQLTITNSVLFKFDKDFQLKSIQEFEKGKSRAPTATDYGSPQLNAAFMAQLGAFDYQYTQIDPVNDRFYACFIDVDREKGEGNKPYFKTIIYDEGEISEDKIPLKSNKKNFRVYPAKLGHVMWLEYNKKEKVLDLHLEKINIK